MPHTLSATWDQEVDLLVAGAGAGGMSTALVASLEGLSVLLCEKSGQIGGTAATSAGTIWIPGNTPSTKAGYQDTIASGRRYLDALTGRPDTSGLRETYLQSAPQALDYLHSRSDVRFLPSGKHPDYRSDLDGAAVSGRALAPETFDGRLLGKDFRRVRPPISEFMLFGGMMVGKEDIPRLIERYHNAGNLFHAVKLFLRYVTDRIRYPRGTRVTMGNAMVARLFYSLKRRNVPLLFESRILELLEEQGKVRGVVVETPRGPLRVKVRKGVVLATGGYGHNRTLREQFMPTPTPMRSMANVGNTGDGMELGIKYGAAVSPGSHGQGAFWTPVSVVPRPDGSTGLFPHLSLDRAKPGLIAVNRAGKRFVNEGASYHDFVEGMYASQRGTSSIPAYLICEADFVRRYGLGPIHPGTRDLSPYAMLGYLELAPTLRDLAQRMDMDAETLLATVERHNQFARDGKDLDFSKGDTELSRFNGDASNKPNPCLKEIKRGPFVALAVWPAEIGTSTGLDTDANGRVLDKNGQAIEGLYACGSDMASVMLGSYPGPGTTLGPALTFGWRIGLHAAGRPAPTYNPPQP